MRNTVETVQNTDITTQIFNYLTQNLKNINKMSKKEIKNYINLLSKLLKNKNISKTDKKKIQDNINLLSKLLKNKNIS